MNMVESQKWAFATRRLDTDELDNALKESSEIYFSIRSKLVVAGSDKALKESPEIYFSIRSKIDILDTDNLLIVHHVKSFPDWEYFIDTFNNSHIPVSMFNWVKILKDTIVLGSSQYGAYDHFLYKEMGTCNIEDLKNIENIIINRKKFYTENPQK